MAQHGSDAQMFALIPVPTGEYLEHRKALNKIEQGGLDFDIYCMLWANAKTTGSQSTMRSSKSKLIFPTYDADAEFDVMIMPKTVQDAYRELCSSMSKVETERARAKKEADTAAEIAKMVAAAKKAAEEKLAKDKQEAEDKAKAMALVIRLWKLLCRRDGRHGRANPRRPSPMKKLRKQGFKLAGRDAQPALVIGRHCVTERDSAPVQYNGIV